VPPGPEPAGGLTSRSGDEPNGPAQANRVLALVALGAGPAVERGCRLAEMADDPRDPAVLGPVPVPKALPDKETAAAEGAERHLPHERKDGFGRRGMPQKAGTCGILSGR
jgi:hypothetical protein